jgi:hypothetical protein
VVASQLTLLKLLEPGSRWFENGGDAIEPRPGDPSKLPLTVCSPSVIVLLVIVLLRAPSFSRQEIGHDG